jgi:hypothetical protein
VSQTPLAQPALAVHGAQLAAGVAEPELDDDPEELAPLELLAPELLGEPDAPELLEVDAAALDELVTEVPEEEDAAEVVEVGVPLLLELEEAVADWVVAPEELDEDDECVEVPDDAPPEVVPAIDPVEPEPWVPDEALPELALL